MTYDATDPRPDGVRTTMVRQSIDHQWQVHLPLGGTGPVGGWLGAIRRFRAEVLYDNGRRPVFRNTDGTFHDDDPADLAAYHVTATYEGKLAATLRVVPIATTRDGVCERIFGSDGVDRLLVRLGLNRGAVWEGSGWAVHPTRRGGVLGAKVVAAGSSVAARLGMTTSIGAVGTRYGQAYRLLSIGYRCAEGFSRVPVPELADDIQLMHATFSEMEPDFRILAAGMANQLQWDSTPRTPSPSTPPPGSRPGDWCFGAGPDPTGRRETSELSTRR